jgi:hypothetical protein
MINQLKCSAASHRTELPKPAGDEGVDRVGEPRCQVVFDLVAEAAHDPSGDRHAVADVDSGAKLVQLEGFAAPGLVGQRPQST